MGAFFVPRGFHMENQESHQPGHNKKEPILESRRSMTHPARTSDPPFSLVQRAQEIEKADEVVQSHVHGKLDVIARQIRTLQEEAKKIIGKAERDMELHRIKCNFEKKPGMALYLYQKQNGDKLFSILSPAEWGSSLPHEFLGAFRLAADGSFDDLEETDSI